jgi:hydrogenase-4 component B
VNSPEQAVINAILLCLGGALLALAVSKNKSLAGWVSFLVTLAAGGSALYAATTVLATGPGTPIAFLPRFGFALRLYVDGLSAVFLILIATVSIPAALFSITYMTHYPDYGVHRYYPYFLIFTAALYGLVSTTDMMYFFFIFWQMMTLTGTALIRFENKQAQNRRAAWKYLWMMQIACLVTMVGAGLLATGGVTTTAGEPLMKYDFEAVHQHLPALLKAHSGMVGLAFGLFLIGFGIKLGMWPFGQMWLPDAHPAAPSPVSAMLSGVKIKTGVYGIMRYFLWLVPAEAQADFPTAKWGLIIAVLGTITLFTGTMQALKQDQTKRLLAFHSIGQVGYILLGLGVCLTLLPSSDWALITVAALGFYGALFHTLNHGLFKSLLFLNSGAMLRATDTQAMDRLGGLLKFMPVTAATALIASFSISGLPLFNGFASKWCIYISAIQGSSEAWILAVCAVVALLTSLLTLASFIKFFGACFLSRTSAWVAHKAGRQTSLDSGWIMNLPQCFLAGLCLLLGLLPALAFKLIAAALASSQQGLGAVLARTTPANSGWETGLSGLNGQAVFAPLCLAMVLGVMLLTALWISHWGYAPRRAAAPWLCGYVVASDIHRYAAHNFYREIKRYFHWIGGEPARSGKASKSSLPSNHPLPDPPSIHP